MKAFGYGRGRMRVLAKHHFPFWFQLFSILHPFLFLFTLNSLERCFRWNLCKGRCYEFFSSYAPDSK